MVLVLWVLVAVAVVLAVLAVATGRWNVDPLSEPTRSTPDHGLPADPVATDVDDVRVDTAARGYRMQDVDDRLDVLRVELARRERELASLEAAATVARRGGGGVGEVAAPDGHTTGTPDPANPAGLDAGPRPKAPGEG